MIGKELLNYRIVALIGKGGMGTVYLAVNKYIQEQRVAIKVINAGMINGFTRGKLEDEAHRLAQLDHQNLVHFVNFHIDDSGTVYLVMDYAEGCNIETYLRDASAPVADGDICRLFDPILDGISYAHCHGIIHCDIKPSNVLITTDGSVKVLDFGIAQIISDQAVDGEPMVMGTPSYMSPEQVKGEPLDERSDIYSLGVLLHQMLTGNAPYDTTTLSEYEIMQRVVEEPLPRLATYSVRVSRRVQDVVDKATDKDPSKRYQSCEQFKEALHRAIYPHRTPRWVKFTALAAVLLLVGVSWGIWEYHRTKVTYYKDYVERWGVPEGIGRLSTAERSRISRCYKFVESKGKLLSVSHVNSLGNLIDDGETVRSDRPVHMQLSYKGDGSIHNVKVMDRSGKVLYVKNYNDKLNVMTFQYDDEHNTERVLANATVGFIQSLDGDVNPRGRISRWWIEYDDRGFVKSERFHSFDNSAVRDANGIYGQDYVRDDKGRPLEIHYVDFDGQLQSTKWGLGIKQYEYDSNDNLVKATYLTINRLPAVEDDGGCSIYVMEYDDNGNVIETAHFDGNGHPMLPKKLGVWAIRIEYDERWLPMRWRFLDTDGQPVYARGFGGAAIVESVYDDNGYECRRTFMDGDGQIVESNLGYAMIESVNDHHGNPLETWYRDRYGEFCDTAEGYAGVKMEYDEDGNRIKEVAYDKDKRPTNTRYVTAATLLEYDDRHLLTKVTNLDKDLQPAPDYMSQVIVAYEYDKRGNLTKTSYYEADGKTLRLSAQGIAAIVKAYDENGNLVSQVTLGTDGQPTVSPVLQSAKAGYTYDDNGNLATIRFYDVSDRPTLVNGLAGIDYINDRSGNVLEEKPIGIDGHLAKGMLVTKRKYDRQGNIIESAVFDESGPTVNTVKVHRTEVDYNRRNQIVETRFYGIDGKPAVSHDDKHCAVSRFEYDDKGNAVKQSLFGTDGTLLSSASTDWAICRMVYDRHDNLSEVTYFDSSDEPKLCKMGYHRLRIGYDNLNRVVENSYFGIDDEPVVCRGFHKERFVYDNTSEYPSQHTFYDINDRPVDCDEGWQKLTVEYDSYGMPVTQSFYDKSGTLMATQVRKGDQWELKCDWRQTARMIAGSLPVSQDIMTIYALEVTGKNTCHLKMRLHYNRSDFDGGTFGQIEDYVQQMACNIAKELEFKAQVTAVLYDPQGSVLYTASSSQR